MAHGKHRTARSRRWRGTGLGTIGQGAAPDGRVPARLPQRHDRRQGHRAGRVLCRTRARPCCGSTIPAMAQAAARSRMAPSAAGPTTHWPHRCADARARWSWSVHRWADGSPCGRRSHARIASPRCLALPRRPTSPKSLMWQAMSFEQRAALMRDGVLQVPSQYGEPYPITRGLIEDGRTRLLLEQKIALDCPVRLLHGQRDPDVPWEIALRIAEQVTSAGCAGDAGEGRRPPVVAAAGPGAADRNVGRAASEIQIGVVRRRGHSGHTVRQDAAKTRA